MLHPAYTGILLFLRTFTSMKKSLALLVALSSAFYFHAQTTIFSEDFETGMDGWTIHIEDGFEVDTSVYEFTPGWILLADPGSDPADTVAGATSFFQTPETANRWLISPPITVGAYGNILKWSARSHDPSFPDRYQILVSTTTTDITAFTRADSVIAEYEDWTERSINLSDSGYVDQTIYVAFRLTSYDKFKLYLDDISVVIEDPVGLNENAAPQVVLYPNPASSTVYISSEETMKDYRILAMSGQIVASGKPSNNSIELSSIPAGTYLLELRTEDNRVVRQRLVKQ